VRIHSKLGSAHPGVTLWDFLDARGLDPNDPVVPAAHQRALEFDTRRSTLVRDARSAGICAQREKR
jgi:hypothetical protein